MSKYTAVQRRSSSPAHGRKTKTTLADRFWLFVGAGILGTVTALVLAIPVCILLAQFSPMFSISSGSGQHHILWLCFCPGLVSGLGGAFFPDVTADCIARLGHGIAFLWRLIAG